MTRKEKHKRVFVRLICTYLYLFVSRSYKRLFHTSELLNGVRLEMSKVQIYASWNQQISSWGRQKLCIWKYDTNHYNLQFQF